MKPDLVADHGGGEAPDEDGGEVQLALVGEEPGGEEERVAGEEEADEQPVSAKMMSISPISP